ncbi:hypothetical protein [Pasteurella multocida]|uniref:hypothetical protein n=1 Tax=Pasteurella multocida TaxID=747 RepID=UPI00159B9EC5|nr:hypothetical protein [Pasteurella multocida]MDY0632886.1 hypothetical protein [Pasteurella multocida]
MDGRASFALKGRIDKAMNSLMDKYNYSHNNASFDILSLENNNYTLKSSNDSPFSYHIYLRKEFQKAISEPGNIKKFHFHFHFLRQILEKLATFLGYKNWADLISDAPNHKYIKRLLDFSSHAKHSGEEMVEITSKDKSFSLLASLHHNHDYTPHKYR